MKDLYYILGTDRNCTQAELNAAYRTLAQKLQPPGQSPDRFLDDHFAEITDAYKILSDPTRRRKYDEAFKKSNRRWIQHFRTRHINIAVTLALMAFTGIFGMYVMKAIKGHVIKGSVKPLTAVTVTKHFKKAHKKWTHGHPLSAASTVKQITSKSDTVTNAPVKAVPLESFAVKPAARQVSKPFEAPIAKPVEPAISTPDDQHDNSYATYLKANTTGVVYLHSAASYRSPVLANIPKNARVMVMEKGQGFAKVSFNGRTGYVPGWTVEQ